MFYIEEIKLKDAEGLLTACGLTKPQGVDYTAGVFSMESGACGAGDGFEDGAFGKGRLAATGSLKGDMLQGIAVDPEFQGEDLTGKLLTHLIGAGRKRGFHSLYLFTKPEKTTQFIGLGFRLVAKAGPYAALLEWGEEGVKEYMDQLAAVRKQTESGVAASLSASGTGALVMNCNPFTKGHRYLIEYAAVRKRHVYVLAVEEDVSLFSFADRLEMLRRGTADLPNVTVIPGGRYAVSTLTFPSYFTGAENLAAAHAAMDGELFASCIAPALGVDERFLGTEPLSAVTAVYNETLKARLPKRGIAVTEVPRLKCTEAEEGEAVISATKVREILRNGWRSAGLEHGLSAECVGLLRSFLPETTLAYLQKPGVLQHLAEAFAAEQEESHG